MEYAWSFPRERTIAQRLSEFRDSDGAYRHRRVGALF